ncbi:MAG TPA: hypothetical protein VGF48_17280 [Thermoanaerobaculia bacterium]
MISLAHQQITREWWDRHRRGFDLHISELVLYEIRRGDPAAAQARAVRRELTERFGTDIDALCDFLQEQEREHPERLVNRPPRRPVPIATRD